MSGDTLRVAFFPDAYHEIDGVANTSRQFEAYARRRQLPFLTVLGGTQSREESEGSVSRMELKRGKIGFPLDKNHDFDLAFLRHYDQVAARVKSFNPDIVHITGPSDVGILGCFIAHNLKIPLAASWHTNLHEYAAQRWRALLNWVPGKVAEPFAAAIGRGSLACVLRFYHIPQILFAPNPELVDLVKRGTGKTCCLMGRGVDTELFNPNRRTRSGDPFVIGYVGRLTVEKNIRFLAEIEQALLARNCSNFEILIVGQGTEEKWLRSHMKNARFTGVLRGESLAAAYANMDVFVFPSRTDTYGNVVREAHASGVPTIVTDSGGPRYLVRNHETGFIAGTAEEYAALIAGLQKHSGQLASMRAAARSAAFASSWDAIFAGVYRDYEQGLHAALAAGKNVRRRAAAPLMSPLQG